MTISFVRTIILYLIVIIALRLMGKRQIGELAPSELVVTILISELAAIPMQDPGLSLLSGVVPILTLLCLEILISTCTLKSRGFRKALIGTSSMLIDNGVINQQEMHRMRLTLDELLEEVRLKGYADITQIKYAILETNGKLSVISHPEFENLTRQDMNIDINDNDLPVTVISDGKLSEKGLQRIEKDAAWVEQELKRAGYQRVGQIFLMQFIPVQNKITLLPKALK